MSGITGMLHVSPISPRHTTRHHPDEMTTDDETFVRFIYKKCNFSFGRFNDDDPTYCVKTLVFFCFFFIYISLRQLSQTRVEPTAFAGKEEEGGESS